MKNERMNWWTPLCVSMLIVALGGTGFARCDVRVAVGGTPYMLEINPLAGIYFEEKDYGGADLCLSFDPAGHAGFTRQLVEVALARSRE